jgi:hypothetical protein
VNIWFIGVTWPRVFDADSFRRLARGGDGLLDLPGGTAQVLPLDVGGDAHVALHRATVDLTRHDALAHLGHVADH